MLKQALINIESPYRDIPWKNDSIIDIDLWRVHIIIGHLDGWKTAEIEAANIAWTNDAYTFRSIVTGIAKEDDTLCIYSIGGAIDDCLNKLGEKKYDRNTWVTPQIKTTYEGLSAHDIECMKKSRHPFPEYRDGDIYRIIPASVFLEEDWWIDKWATVLLLSEVSCEYKEHLMDALNKKDYKTSAKLAFSSPSGSIEVERSFTNNPKMLNSVPLYVMSCGNARCGSSCNFYSKLINLSEFLYSTVDILNITGYTCYLSKGLKTFKEYLTTGRLPLGLQILTRDTLPKSYEQDDYLDDEEI